MRLVLIVVGVLFLNAVLASLVWRLVSAKRQILRGMGRIFATFFCLLNLVLAGTSLVHLWRHGGDWFYIVLLLLGLIFAFRFGGGIGGAHH